MGAIATILVTLGSMALSYGLSEAVNYIENSINKSNGVDYNTVADTIDKIVNEARAKGNRIYNQVIDRLNNLKSLTMNSNGLVRDIYRDAIRSYSKEATGIEKKLDEIDTKGSLIQQKAQQLLNSPNSYKIAYGKGEVEQLKKDTGELINKISNNNPEQNKQNYNLNGGNLENNYEKTIQ